MTCRNCGERWNAGQGNICPQCGAINAAAQSGVMKSSTILISSGETEAVYRSVKEVPAALRRKLLKSTNGLNAATILIADRRGREEIARAIRNLPSSLHRRVPRGYREDAPGKPAWELRPLLKALAAGLLGAGSVIAVWFAFTHRW
jgi:hypothetical protein